MLQSTNKKIGVYVDIFGIHIVRPVLLTGRITNKMCATWAFAWSVRNELMCGKRIHTHEYDHHLCVWFFFSFLLSSLWCRTLCLESDCSSVILRQENPNKKNESAVECVCFINMWRHNERNGPSQHKSEQHFSGRDRAHVVHMIKLNEFTRIKYHLFQRSAVSLWFCCCCCCFPSIYVHTWHVSLCRRANRMAKAIEIGTSWLGTWGAELTRCIHQKKPYYIG